MKVLLKMMPQVIRRYRGKRKTVTVGFLFLILLAGFLFGASSIYYKMTCVFSSPVALLEQIQTDQPFSERCRPDLQNLGSVKLDLQKIPTFDEISARRIHVKKGGQWKPTDCVPRQKLAIVIPHRQREEALKILLDSLHDMLHRQKLNYRIFVLQQSWKEEFNRGRIMNAGFIEALKYDDYDCFIFHDADLIPEDYRNLYMCSDNGTRHLSSALKKWNYRMIYCSLTGGVVAINRKNMIKINGFSNFYWGWGGEDDDFSARHQEAGITRTNSPEDIGRYTMAHHAVEKRSDTRSDFFSKWRGRWKRDGLNDHFGSTYTVVNRQDTNLYTNITIDLGSKIEHMLHFPHNIESESSWWIWKFYHW